MSIRNENIFVGCATYQMSRIYRHLLRRLYLWALCWWRRWKQPLDFGHTVNNRRWKKRFTQTILLNLFKSNWVWLGLTRSWITKWLRVRSTFNSIALRHRHSKDGMILLFGELTKHSCNAPFGNPSTPRLTHGTLICWCRSVICFYPHAHTTTAFT